MTGDADKPETRVPGVYELAGVIVASKVAHLHPASVDRFLDEIVEESLAQARKIAQKLQEARDTER